MTDEAKALVERLRWSHWYYEDAGENTSYTSEAPLEAADLIETQAREIERLREALRQYVYETTSLSPREDDGSHWCKISANCLSNARAALAGDSHDQ